MSFAPICLLAQKTYYYKLSKEVYNGTTSLNVSGGQFITFIGDICFESDKKGFGVGHGVLTMSKDYSTSTIKIYIGNSYWGENAVFKFTTDLCTLNVVTNEGYTYLYRRATAPTNVTTCSLIRNKSSDLSRNFPTETTLSPSSLPYNNNGGVTANPQRQANNPSNSRKVWHNCSLCQGKRTVVREKTVATFGKDTQWYCNQCGHNVWMSSGHSHVTCLQCRGQGGYYTTE